MALDVEAVTAGLFLAAIAALTALKRPCKVVLNTDSQYVKGGITGWISGWKRNGWKTADKKPVKSPVALASGVAKTPGQAPDSLTFYLYPESDFSVFGTPS